MTRITCDQVYFSLNMYRARKSHVRLIQFLNESSAHSSESGLYSDWPKKSRALGHVGSQLRLVTELQIVLPVKSVNS